VPGIAPNTMAVGPDAVWVLDYHGALTRIEGTGAERRPPSPGASLRRDRTTWRVFVWASSVDLICVLEEGGEESGVPSTDDAY